MIKTILYGDDSKMTKQYFTIQHPDGSLSHSDVSDSREYLEHFYGEDYKIVVCRVVLGDQPMVPLNMVQRIKNVARQMVFSDNEYDIVGTLNDYVDNALESAR